MLTEEQLRTIEAAERAARSGPWTWGVHYIGRPMEMPGSWYEKIAQLPEDQPVEEGNPWERDAAFIAGARTWVPQLLAMVRELQYQLRQAAGELGAVEDSLILERDRVLQLQQRLDRVEAISRCDVQESHDG